MRSTSRNKAPTLWTPPFFSEVPSEAQQYFNRPLDPQSPVSLRELDRAAYFKACIAPVIGRQSEGIRQEVADAAIEHITREGRVLYERYGKHPELNRMLQASFRGVNDEGVHAVVLMRAWQHRATVSSQYEAPASFRDRVRFEPPADVHHRSRQSRNVAVAYIDVCMAPEGYPETPDIVRYPFNEDLRARIILGTQAITAQVQYPEFTGPLSVGIDRMRAAELSAFVSYADSTAVK